jgi:adenosylcobinamide-GDP ribazoletransferase
MNRPALARAPVLAIKHFLLALQFFTRVPVTGWLAAWVGFSPAMLQASVVHFPGVGLLVGLVAAFVYTGAVLALPLGIYLPLVAAVISMVATVLMTGAFHEDGLADVADGLGGSLPRERALEVMKDSRLGTYGVLALVLATLLKLSLLALLGSVVGLVQVAAALVAAHSVSRFFPLLVIWRMVHVGDLAGSKSKPLADSIQSAGVLKGGAWAALALGFATSHWSVASLLVAVITSAAGFAYMRAVFRRRLQGFTGDCLGATQQVCELAFYLGLCVACNLPA